MEPLIKNNNYPRTEYDITTGDIKFVPCVYEQRYTTVHQALCSLSSEVPLKKIIDFGCSELGFFTLLKSMPALELLLHIDIDDETLNNNCNRVKPLLSDYLDPKKHQFRVQICQGSIAEPDPCLINVDAVVCIELIEHLYPTVVEEIPNVIFGLCQPRIAIFTTPNFEYNILFPEPQRFRHFDHKFEWTRQQFQDWAHNVCLRYPNYKVTFRGIGPPPKGYEHIGCATQMATFLKQNTIVSNETLLEQCEPKYKLLYDIVYPIKSDKRTLNEKVFHEIQNKISRLTNPNYEKYDELLYEENNVLIPIEEVLPCVEKYDIDVQHVINILQENGIQVNSEKQLVVSYYVDSSSSEDSTDFSCNRICLNAGNEEFWD